MKKQDELIRENEELRARLALAEKWMQREVQWAIQSIQKGRIGWVTRKYFTNIFEEEGLELITERILEQFSGSLQNAPAYTLERLIDAEIYWFTLQKYPHMDGFPIVASYQKILDEFFEEKILIPFRVANHSRTPDSHGLYAPISLEKDIENVLKKRYSLSLGRWFQLFQIIHDKKLYQWMYEELLLMYLQKDHVKLFEICISKPFFSQFSELIGLEVFGRKRHNTKISYTDARRTREIIVGWEQGKWVLEHLLY